MRPVPGELRNCVNCSEARDAVVRGPASDEAPGEAGDPFGDTGGTAPGEASDEAPGEASDEAPGNPFGDAGGTAPGEASDEAPGSPFGDACEEDTARAARTTRARMSHLASCTGLVARAAVWSEAWRRVPAVARSHGAMCL
jgi:hypothetical protein